MMNRVSGFRSLPYLSLGWFLLFIWGCNPNTSQDLAEDKASRETQQDTVYLCTAPRLNYYVLQDEYNEFVRKHDELFADTAVPPGLAHSQYYRNSVNSEDHKIEDFSEFGVDSYFIWYAYLLQQRYNYGAYEMQRQELIDMFRSINEIYSIIAVGGSYFGHMIPRIQAYVEWDLYNHYVQGNPDTLSPQEFSQAKEAFVSQNRFLVQNLGSSELWKRKTEVGKKHTKMELDSMFTALAEQIVNPFYLQRVMEFQERY